MVVGVVRMVGGSIRMVVASLIRMHTILVDRTAMGMATEMLMARVTGRERGPTRDLACIQFCLNLRTLIAKTEMLWLRKQCNCAMRFWMDSIPM
jgi:hypothetical protein